MSRYITITNRPFAVSDKWTARLITDMNWTISGPFGNYQYPGVGAIINLLYGLGLPLRIVDSVTVGLDKEDSEKARVMYYGSLLATIHRNDHQIIVVFTSMSCLSDQHANRHVVINVTLEPNHV